VIEEVGEGVGDWRPGDRVMALVAGGGHATRVVVPAGQLMAVPEGLELGGAAALPEAGLTAWTNLVAEGGLAAGQSVLVTGATGGMGTMAVQVAHHLGARVLAAGRDRERLEPLRKLGVDALVTAGESLTEEVRRATGGRGVDLVFDLVGGAELPRALEALAPRGRLVLVGLLAGRTATLDLGDVLRRRLRLQGSVLRARPREEKARLVAAFTAFALPLLTAGTLRPVVGRSFPFERIGEAYEALRTGGVGGKIVVEVAE
jgi:NADPH:quinone reductase-like Zn-dependent oxidoreductase